MAKNNTPKAVKTEKNAKNTATSTKKTTKKKKKVKVSHIVKPAEMTLEEWQIKLRKQVTETDCKVDGCQSLICSETHQ